MDWRWLRLLLLCQIYIKYAENKEVTALINTKRLIHYVPERFLSMTIDPASLFIAGNLENQALKMARGLHPSFVRLGGKSTNYLKFGKELFVDNNTITEDQWDGVNKFVEKAGLDLIISLNPMQKIQGVWDSRDALQLISYSNRHGYNVAWQLGYDTEGQLTSGDEVGRNIIRLRKILDGFQYYTRTPIFAPDLPIARTQKEVNFIRDMLLQAAPVLGAIFVQLPFNTNDDPGKALTTSLLNMDSQIWNGDLRFEKNVPKKPIWLAEKYPSHGSEMEAINLIKYLGTAAQIGCQIVFRQVGPESLKFPTPDYWLALFYKNLVGRCVFEAKINSGNSSGITLFSHCSKLLPPEKSILDTGYNYEKGAVTVFGVNESPENVKLSLKASTKDEKAHLYILTFQADPEEKFEKTFLNGQLITLSPSGDLPIISPKIKRTIKYGISVPARSIFFIVLPDLKARACSYSSQIINSDVHSLSKKLLNIIPNVLDKTKNDELKSEEEDSKQLYVKFTKTVPLTAQTSDNLSLNIGNLEPDVQVKYITFNDNSWLSKLTETMVSPKIHEHTEEYENSGNNKDKYAVLSAAIAGAHDGSNSSADSIEPSLKRRKRSTNDKSPIEDQDTDGTDPSTVINQEDLVKHLNEYASNVYRNSRGEESDKEIQITNIPDEIFNTLRNVKVTFKDLGTDNSPKEILENSNNNESSTQEGADEEQKHAASLNGVLLSEGNNEHIVLQEEKNLDAILSNNNNLNIYNEEKFQNNPRIAKEINEKEVYNLKSNTAEELDEGSDMKINQEKNSESFQEPSQETSDNSQELHTSLEQRYTTNKNASSEGTTLDREISSLPVRDILSKSGNTGGNFKNNKLFLADETLEGEKEPVGKTEEINYDIGNLQLDEMPTTDNRFDANKNVILIPVKSSESSNIPNVEAKEDEEHLETDEQLRSEAENEQDINKMSPLKYLPPNKNQNEQEKIIHIIEGNDKEIQLSEKLLMSELKGSEEKLNDFEGDQLLLNDPELVTDSRKFSSPSSTTIKYDTNLVSMDERKPSSLIFTLINEDQKGLEDGPPVPLQDSETIKVQREIPISEENIAKNIPLLVLPIKMEDNEDENKNETSLNVEVTNTGGFNKNVLEFPINEGAQKYVMPISKVESLSFSTDNLRDLVKGGKESEISSINVPLINIEEKSYEKEESDSLTNNDPENLFQNLKSNIPLENAMEDVHPIENISNNFADKSSNSEVVKQYPTDKIVTSYEMSPENSLSQLEKELSSSNIPPSFQHQLDSLPVELSHISEYQTNTEGYEKNNAVKNPEKANTIQYKPLTKIISEEENTNSKIPGMAQKADVTKAEIEAERRERLSSLRKQILEMREHFRAQIREEGLKAALLHREEEMRKYLNQDKEFKRKLMTYPIMAHEHNILSRPRRLSYFPESGLSEEDQYDYIDKKTYKKKIDSYGIPISDDKPCSHQQMISNSYSNNGQHDHVLFPLDPNTPQAVVYNDRIIPAKLYGIISLSDEPNFRKSSNIVNKPLGDLPIDSVYQNYYAKHSNSEPVIKRKEGSKISDTSLSQGAYSLPKDNFIKAIDDPMNYIPIVVLSSHGQNNRRKRSLFSEDFIEERNEVKKESKELSDTQLNKKIIEKELKNDEFVKETYDLINEIPNETDKNLNRIEYVHPNEIIIQKQNEIDVKQVPKRFSELLHPHIAPLGYMKSVKFLKNTPPIQNYEKVTTEVDPNHSLLEQSLVVKNQKTVQEPKEKNSNSPTFYFWSMVNEKFKSMIDVLRHLAEWYSSSK